MKAIIDKQHQIATKLLDRGEVVAAPTNTVFGLFCTDDGLNTMYALKSRPHSQPFQQIFISLDIAAKYIDISECVMAVIDKYPIEYLTIIANKKDDDSTIGFRIIDHPLLDGRDYLYATSANKRGEETPQNSQEISKIFPHIFVIDGVAGNIASTIIDCTGKTPIVIRQGKVSI